VTLPPWHEEPISRTHDRERFDCGDPALNTFLRQHARRSHEQGGAKTFLAIADADGATVLGFYSVSPASVAYDRTPELVRRGVARHEVPAFRLARLAVALPMQGRGLGGQLLLAAGRRCLLAATEVGGVALLIDAKADRVANWYASYGAMPLLDAPLSLLLPFATIRTALAEAGKLQLG
jgi:GNAT superfamily N-acetyltransferase